MAKKKEKQVHPTAAQVKDAVNAAKEQEVDKLCAQTIEAALKQFNRALQPFIERTEFADIARVRLTRVPEKAEETPKEKE